MESHPMFRKGLSEGLSEGLSAQVKNLVKLAVRRLTAYCSAIRMLRLTVVWLLCSRARGDAPTSLQLDFPAGERDPPCDGWHVYMSQGGSLTPPKWLVDVATIPRARSIYGTFNKSANNITNTCSSTAPCAVDILDLRATTWSVGRNKLFAAAQKLPYKFCYFIFGDDDVGQVAWMKFNGGKVRLLPFEHESGMEYFDRLLREDMPAIAAVPISGNKRASIGQPKCRGTPSEGHVDICHVDIDAIMNAIHYKAARIMLPYCTHFDKVSWWLSQAIFIELAFMAYPTSTVSYNMLGVPNTEHRPYPRAPHNWTRLPWRTQANALLAERAGADCAVELVTRAGPSTFIQRRLEWPLHQVCETFAQCGVFMSSAYSHEAICSYRGAFWDQPDHQISTVQSETNKRHPRFLPFSMRADLDAF